MMNTPDIIITAEELRERLNANEPLIVLDIRPQSQRAEWKIPGSWYLDTYEQINANNPELLNELIFPENAIVIAVCAAGKTSMIAAEMLRSRNIDAYSLHGGMKEWGMAWNIAELAFSEGIELVQIRRTGKGCISYIISSKGKALIIDPSLPPEVYKTILAKKNLEVCYILETHTHADHLSRALILASFYNAKLLLPEKSKVNYSFNPLIDGAKIQLNEINLTVLFTPGHTFESCSFIVNDQILFSGDTLFINGIGRPDLKADAENTQIKARLLYQSLKQLTSLNNNVMVFPAHVNTPVAFDSKVIYKTIGEIKKNISIMQLNEADFVKELLIRIPQTPANYLEIVAKNILGDFSDVNPVELEAGSNRCAVS